jgi:antitoxin (DNA-binding transcriptional repressor) of toxin-antitoxin stability system
MAVVLTTRFGPERDSIGGGRDRPTRPTLWDMAKPITQRELRNKCGEIMRGLDRGESYLVTRNGVPVGEMVPIRRRRFVSVDAVLEAFAGAPAIDLKRFRSDLDDWIDQGPRDPG